MPKGYSTKTPERVAEAQRLRAEGWQYKDLARHFGVGEKTVHAWVTDPDGVKLRERHERARGTCVDCGARTAWSNGAGPHVRCHRCAPTEAKVWTHEAIVCAVREWADLHGGVPPLAINWSRGLAVRAGKPEAAREYIENPDTWPATVTVVVAMGWNNAIRAAGFDPRLVGYYGREGEDPELCAEIATRYAAGESTIALAREYGCSTMAVRYRARKGGATIRDCSWPRLTDVERAQIVRRYRDGESGTKLAREYGVTPATVYDLLRRRGVAVRRSGPVASAA